MHRCNLGILACNPGSVGAQGAGGKGKVVPGRADSRDVVFSPAAAGQGGPPPQMPPAVTGGAGPLPGGIRMDVQPNVPSSSAQGYPPNMYRWHNVSQGIAYYTVPTVANQPVLPPPSAAVFNCLKTHYAFAYDSSSGSLMIREKSSRDSGSGNVESAAAGSQQTVPGQQQLATAAGMPTPSPGTASSAPDESVDDSRSLPGASPNPWPHTPSQMSQGHRTPAPANRPNTPAVNRRGEPTIVDRLVSVSQIRRLNILIIISIHI
ncbi:unnamed protein product [Gongylonema pulchrum]|uniref:YTH domain-containing protein n=1 Tax=Gongylonema pulchrum TaxID=637853 RepID=A0A183E7A5_9BILA|nr:unnamed protein product [Gongylonema pulchrum]